MRAPSSWNSSFIFWKTLHRQRTSFFSVHTCCNSSHTQIICTLKLGSARAAAASVPAASAPGERASERAGRRGAGPPWTTSPCCRTGRPPTTWRAARATTRAARTATAPSPPRPRRRPTPTSSQGCPLTTPGSTTSTAGPSPATLPTPSWSSAAARCAGSGCWRTASPSWASSWPSSCSPSGSSAALP